MEDGHRHRPRSRRAAIAVFALIHPQLQVDVMVSNRLAVADIIPICPCKGCLFFAIVVDFVSRQIDGWSMGKRIDR